jgi:hypothetical protein
MMIYSALSEPKQIGFFLCALFAMSQGAARKAYLNSVWLAIIGIE